MSISLGYQPQQLTVTLSPGSVFSSGLTNTESDWDGGVSIALLFDDPNATTWAATISGATASWDVASADVDTLLAAAAEHVALLYTVGGETQKWGVGGIVVTR